jgi:hypothetical protein
MIARKRHLHGSFVGHAYLLLDTGTQIETVASTPRRKWNPMRTHAGLASGSISRSTAAAILRAQRTRERLAAKVAR